jgi:phosphomannomutase
MKEKAYIFDVDGTLTPSRGVMDAEFKELFLAFAKEHTVYLITGSDRPKTFEQVGFEIYEACKAVYQCNGGEVWEGNRRVRNHEWKLSYEVKHFLDQLIHHSRYPIKTGTHLESRTGMVNISTVGRDCNQQQREDYAKWDAVNNERKALAMVIEKQFSDLQTAIGGQISIDIYPKGLNKSVIANDLNEEYELYFYGDKCNHGGNDYPLSMIIELGHYGKSFNVKDWNETMEYLKEETK